MIKSYKYLNFINYMLLYSYNVAHTLNLIQYILIHLTHISHILTLPPKPNYSVRDNLVYW
ncbi:hypothetical protein BCR32DRAFT_49472 [Anaeromyces robustus]|uniref:Uncharacterized protein n=1 Tax=Anaeromyces robustus TaxID=1754192 RepID=A0A1Y1WXQ7_9FUNG|nr:hypothetical protein BCR32DRAFT_49472 [Anaeromyces robustus]|eukprot:ORX78293.1 hypothetical protein BCR32DRAFT_49472 [Anaeromyces robustus]